jgi:D-sedoheptulose 7-phosphate isomerase
MRDSFERIVDLLAASGKYGSLMRMIADRPVVRKIYADLIEAHPEMEPCLEDLLGMHLALVECFDGGGRLFVCGNGGSHADALHITGELCKSFERKRPLHPDFTARLTGLPFGEELRARLQRGLPAMVLGGNAALGSAVTNDTGDGRLVLAHECLALARRGDMLLGISTSGRAENVRMAASTARALEMTVAAFCGEGGGPLAEIADIAVRAPGARTARVQESHVILYHALCAGVEGHFFPESGG